MRLADVVRHIRTGNSITKILPEELLSADFRQIDTFLRDDLNLNNEIAFFDAETIAPTVVIEIECKKYVNLFPLTMLVDMVNSYYALDNRLTDTEIANRMLAYRKKDA